MTIIKRVLVIFLVFELGLPSLANAESRNCTPEEKAKADKQLFLNKRDKDLALKQHLPWGIPSSSEDEQLLIQRDYIISYSNELRVPVWTAHRLVEKELKGGDRVNCFRTDPRVNAKDASLPSDFSEPIFDQGHLTPNGDMAKGVTPVVNSFVMSNMAPQYCQFNRGVWQIFESIVRLYMKERGTVYVLTGSVFDRNGDGHRDPNEDAKRMKSNNGKTRVAVPTHFYKILIHQQENGGIESLAVMLPHDQTDLDGDDALDYLTAHIQSIAEIEAITGINFFPGIGVTDPAAAAAVENDKLGALWPFSGTPARSLVAAPCRKTAGADQQ